MPITPTEKIWLDGELVDWDKARIHVLTHSLHYGSGVFEGIRAYPTSRGVAVFRLTDHINRLFTSAKVFMIDMPFSPDEIVEASKDGRARRTASTTAATSGPSSTSATARWASTPCRVPSAWPSRPGRGARTSGTRAWPTASGSRCRRGSATTPTPCPPRPRGPGMYVNSSLAKVEALKAGYDEAVLLAPDGRVSECTGENIFVVRGRTRRHPADVGVRRTGGHHPGLGADHRHGPRVTSSSPRRSSAPTSTPPTRPSSPGRRPRWSPSARSTTVPWGPGGRGP